MRHIQALLYRSLWHRLAQDPSLAPLAKRHAVGAAAAKVINATVGDIYGEVEHGDCPLSHSYVSWVEHVAQGRPWLRTCMRRRQLHR